MRSSFFACLAACSLSLALPPCSAATTSYVYCYFSDGGSYWALTSEDKWYQLPGEWKTTKRTGIKKFFVSTVLYDDIANACEQGRKSQKLTGSLQAAFASGNVSNYPIVLGKLELFADQ